MSLDFSKRSARKILERIIPVAKRSGIPLLKLQICEVFPITNLDACKVNQ